MTEAELNRVVVVLVRARNPANIGAAARALHDFGFRHLRVVNEFPVPFASAKSAVDASAVLQAATEHTSVGDAVADCTLVVGTTAVGERKLQHPLYPLNEAVQRTRAALQAGKENKVALLFGSEKTGLSNSELSHCHALLTIPMNASAGARHLSMNLGQAVAVCLYAIAHGESSAAVQTGSGPAAMSPPPEPPQAGDLERLTALLLKFLHESGYARRHPANSREENIRKLVRTMALNGPEAQVWMGILRQAGYALRGKAGEGRTVEASES